MRNFCRCFGEIFKLHRDQRTVLGFMGSFTILLVFYTVNFIPFYYLLVLVLHFVLRFEALMKSKGGTIEASWN